jgi:hypothetical protein
MTRTILTLAASWLSLLTFGQVTERQKMIELGKTYKDFMFRNEPTKPILNEAKADVPEGLRTAAEFIVQTISTKNQLLTTPYLTRPDDAVLKQIYIIRAINLNLREEYQVDNNHLIDSLSSKEIPTYELVDNYYSMLFTAVGNKSQPFDLSKADLKMKEYNFRDDTEKGIMFLRCMDYCGMTIWGYMNVVKPPNTSKAYAHIKKFPKVNGLPYYQYSDFYWPDFEMTIIKDKAPQSYKSFYLDKYYGTLMTHVICLNKEGASEKEVNDLLLGSILKERNLYKYTQHKETLEGAFQEQKVE